MSLDVNQRLPAFFTTTLVREAFDGVIGHKAVLKTLKRIGAIENVDACPLHVDPQILRDELPTIYHRCVELILEKRLNGEKSKRGRR